MTLWPPHVRIDPIDGATLVEAMKVGLNFQEVVVREGDDSPPSKPMSLADFCKRNIGPFNEATPSKAELLIAARFVEMHQWVSQSLHFAGSTFNRDAMVEVTNEMRLAATQRAAFERATAHVIEPTDDEDSAQRIIDAAFPKHQVTQAFGEGFDPDRVAQAFAEELVKVEPKGPAEDHIRAVCAELADFLVDKNKKYGNSALEPMRVFSQAAADEQILVRLDDKLSRIKSRQNNEDEDPIKDLVGYLVLYLVSRRLKAAREEERSSE